MPNAQNIEMLEQIKGDLEGASAMWVVDYRGLTVADIQSLRRNVRDAGAVMKVYKNTIMHLALEQTDQPTLDDLLAGPSAFVFAGEDAAAAAKAVKDFAKGNDNLAIKGGLMDAVALSAAEVEAIASLPRGAHRPDRRRHLRCGPWPCHRHQRGAPGPGPGYEGRGRPEGRLAARAA